MKTKLWQLQQNMKSEWWPILFTAAMLEGRFEEIFKKLDQEPKPCAPGNKLLTQNIFTFVIHFK